MNTSTAAVAGPSANCSGAIQAGVPISLPVRRWSRQRPRDAEIDHLGAEVRQQDVARLEVAVHHPGAVMAVSAAAMPTASPSRSLAESLPLAATARSRSTPSTYSVTR
jgi:hypothetical protein